MKAKYEYIKEDEDFACIQSYDGRNCGEVECDHLPFCFFHIDKEEYKRIIKNKNLWAVQHLQSDKKNLKAAAIAIIKHYIIWK